MQKSVFMLLIGFITLSCGTSQLVQDTPSAETPVEQRESQLKVIEVAPGKILSPGSISERSNPENSAGARPK